MLQYLTNFSCLLEVGTRGNVTTAQEIYHRLVAELDREDKAPIGFLISAWPEGTGTSLWIQDDTDGNPEHVARFVLRCAKAFGLRGQWGFSWSRTCSQASIGAFGGGARVVDLGQGKTLAWVETELWLARNLDIFQPAGRDPWTALH